MELLSKLLGFLGAIINFFSWNRKREVEKLNAKNATEAIKKKVAEVPKPQLDDKTDPLGLRRWNDGM